MKNTSIAFYFMFFQTLAVAQVLPDQIWLLGSNDIPGQPLHGNAVVKFEAGQVNAFAADLKMNFEATTAAMPDSLGNILFYTNGCYIANSIGDTMANGASLNPGEMADWTCPTTGYVAPLGAMALKIPDNLGRYILFHMGVRYDPKGRLDYGPLYYSEIDMSLDDGMGAVIGKNIPLVGGALEPFTAVRHANGRDWWLVVPEYGSNKYHKFYLSAKGVQFFETQMIGSPLHGQYIGSSTFSLDGSKYARQQDIGVVVMDFDRCNGQFSNPEYLPLPANANMGGGVAFSKDLSKIWTNAHRVIYEADLNSSSPVLDTLIIPHTLNNTSILWMQYGPDGRVYFANQGRTSGIHLLKTTNQASLEFQFRGLSLPVYNIRTLPNFPNFRLYDLPGSPCDTLGINAPVATQEAEQNNTLSLYPNPFQTGIWVNGALRGPGAQLQVFDNLGRLCARQELVGLPQFMPLEQLPAGVYPYRVIEGSQGGILKYGCLVKK